MKKTALVYAPALAHDYPQHPEHAGRGMAIKELLEVKGVWGEMMLVENMPASNTQLRRVHTQRLLDGLQQVELRGGGRINADTYATPDSFTLAKLAAGGCTLAVDKIMTGEVDNGLAIVRPPGHHAEHDAAGGFCLVNNIAVAARHAQAVYGVERVLIVDFDVHHGNGTQDIFYDDPSVLFISSQLYMPGYFYPGTGSVGEIGTGTGRGTTINIPLPTGVGDKAYEQIFRELVVPTATAFQPQLILVSAGFDAHWADPLAEADLSLQGYQQLVRILLELADDVCDGRILFVLEGGYLLEALAYGMLNLSYGLLGKDLLVDPLGQSGRAERDISPLLNDLQRLHLRS